MSVPRPLSCLWSMPSSGTGKVAVEGDLDYDTADLLAEVVGSGLAGGSGWSDVRVDCAALEHCDSYGLSVLLMVRRIVADAGARLHLDNRGSGLERMLTLTGTLTHLTGERARQGA